MWFVQKVQIRNWDPYIRVVLSGPPGSAYIVRYFRDGGAKSPPRTWAPDDGSFVAEGKSSVALR